MCVSVCVHEMLGDCVMHEYVALHCGGHSYKYCSWLEGGGFLPKLHPLDEVAQSAPFQGKQYKLQKKTKKECQASV